MSDVTRWTLDTPAPQPATWPEADQEPAVTGAATHTGTDPLGRAVGPAEDHTQVKKVMDEDGKVVTPGEATAKRRTRKAADG